MSEFLEKIPDLVEVLSLVLTALTILATVIVRITPSKKDDEILDGISGKLLKVLSWLPTIGLNPRTKQLESALRDLKKEEVKDESPKTA